MVNQIRKVQVMDHRPDPHEAELRILVEVDFVTPATELKGRLIGPRCADRSTIEIAHPMRPIRPDPEEPRHLQVRVVIPEPSFWEPATPFLYEGPLELWQDGELCSHVMVSHGIGRIESP